MDEVYLAILGGDDRLRARIDEALRPIRECSKRLREDVGEVPTPRFEAGYALIRRACKRFEAFANAFERSLSADDPSTALQEIDTANTEGTELIVRAGQLIEARLTANRPLPRVGGASEESRVEPRFSRIGSELARKQVEVRCWSESEWPRVVGEWGAYIGTNDIGAFAQPDTDRASLAPETCRALVGFTYERERPEQRRRARRGGLRRRRPRRMSPSTCSRPRRARPTRSATACRRSGGSPGVSGRTPPTQTGWRCGTGSSSIPPSPRTTESGECVNGRSLETAANPDKARAGP